MRRQNLSNRTASGHTVSHFGGSASARQHFENLVSIFNNYVPNFSLFVMWSTISPLVLLVFSFHVETTLNKGKEPTIEELYIHIHCRPENGKSPVVARIESALLADSATNENGDGNGLMDPTSEETTTQVQDFDISSLQFTNTKSQAVYVSCNI